MEWCRIITTSISWSFKCYEFFYFIGFISALYVYNLTVLQSIVIERSHIRTRINSNPTSLYILYRSKGSRCSRSYVNITCCSSHILFLLYKYFMVPMLNLASRNILNYLYFHLRQISYPICYILLIGNYHVMGNNKHLLLLFLQLLRL